MLSAGTANWKFIFCAECHIFSDTVTYASSSGIGAVLSQTQEYGKQLQNTAKLRLDTVLTLSARFVVRCFCSQTCEIPRGGYGARARNGVRRAHDAIDRASAAIYCR